MPQLSFVYQQATLSVFPLKTKSATEVVQGYIDNVYAKFCGLNFV